MALEHTRALRPRFTLKRSVKSLLVQQTAALEYMDLRGRLHMS